MHSSAQIGSKLQNGKITSIRHHLCTARTILIHCLNQGPSVFQGGYEGNRLKSVRFCVSLWQAKGVSRSSLTALFVPFRIELASDCETARYTRIRFFRGVSQIGAPQNVSNVSPKPFFLSQNHYGFTRSVSNTERLADGEGFEPSVGLTPQPLSRRPH